MKLECELLQGAWGNQVNGIALAGKGGRETLASHVSKPETTSSLLLTMANTRGEKNPCFTSEYVEILYM